MSRSSENNVAARVRVMPCVGWAVAFFVLSPLASADTLPASVSACASEIDANRRLACFDDAVAPYVANSAAVGRRQNHVIAGLGTAAPGGTAGIVGTAAPAGTAGPAATGALAGPAVSGPAQAVPAPALGGASTPPAVSQPPEHVMARVVSLKNSGDRLVVHLDNGDVWKQIEDANGTLNLRVGDTVTVDKSLGSYWLSGRSQISMKVRRE